MVMKILKGDTLEAQVRHADRVLDRINRKTAVRTATGFITPFPLSAYSDTAGVVFKHMFPAKGTINVAVVHVDKAPKNGFRINLEMGRGKNSIKHSEFIKDDHISVKLGIAVQVGDRLTISTEPANEGEEIAGVWVSLLWTPDVKDTTAKQFLIEELEKAAGKNLIDIAGDDDEGE